MSVKAKDIVIKNIVYQSADGKGYSSEKCSQEVQGLILCRSLQ